MFYRNTDLTNGNFLKYFTNVTTLVYQSFYQCYSLKSIDIQNVKTIGNSIFDSCTSLQMLDLSKLTPNSKISSTDNYLSYICKNCTSLIECILPNGANTIGEYAFYGCSLLKTIIIPESVTYLGRDAFCESGLEKIELPSNITELGYEVLARTKIVSITFPKSVTTLHGSELSSTDTLRWIKCLPIIPPTGGNQWTFVNGGNAPIYVPDESIEAYKVATGMTYYASRFRKLSQFGTDFPNG